MPRFATSSMFFHEYSCEEIFTFAEEAGCTGIEFWLETPDFWLHDQPVEEIRDLIRSHQTLAPITVHAPSLDLNPCSINPDVARISVAQAVHAIRTAERLWATTITLHPGRRTARRPPSGTDYERFEYYISALGDAARGRQVRVAIENMEPKVNSLLCTPEDLSELLHNEPWLYFTLDTAHAMAGRPGDLMNYIDCCHARIANVHVSAKEGSKMHTPPHGNTEVKNALERLRSYGYSGSLTLELEDMNMETTGGSEGKIMQLAKEVKFLKMCWKYSE